MSNTNFKNIVGIGTILLTGFFCYRFSTVLSEEIKKPVVPSNQLEATKVYLENEGFKTVVIKDTLLVKMQFNDTVRIIKCVAATRDSFERVWYITNTGKRGISNESNHPIRWFVLNMYMPDRVNLKPL